NKNSQQTYLDVVVTGSARVLFGSIHQLKQDALVLTYNLPELVSLVL
ncbi:hypothetical protein A2U01_0002177, partial [Trifolium medium]|nr:hypothetical protein [Trifolium medium]